MEAVYPLTKRDATGDLLDGSKYNYTIRFPAGQPLIADCWRAPLPVY